jgi:hypothetical protein
VVDGLFGAFFDGFGSGLAECFAAQCEDPFEQGLEQVGADEGEGLQAGLDGDLFASGLLSSSISGAPWGTVMPLSWSSIWSSGWGTCRARSQVA